MTMSDVFHVRLLRRTYPRIDLDMSRLCGAFSKVHGGKVPTKGEAIAWAIRRTAADVLGDDKTEGLRNGKDTGAGADETNHIDAKAHGGADA